MSTNRKYFLMVRKEITLSDNNRRATNPGNITYALALVKGVVSKKGSSIRFKIEKIGSVIFVHKEECCCGVGTEEHCC
jgi:hypothetical protein